MDERDFADMEKESADRLFDGGSDTCESCGEPMGDDAPLYEDADICRKCHDELAEAESNTPLRQQEGSER